MPRLALQQRLLALGMIRAGRTHREVAQHFNCHLNTVDRLVQRYAQHNDVRDRPRSGRPRVTTPAQDRYIRVTHLRYRLQTATTTARNIPNLRRIHPQTVINRLREYGLRPRRPAIRPILTLRHRQARLQWCRHHLRHPLLWWRHVLFTDECRFHLSSSDGRQRVYRRRNERYADPCVVERNRYGGGSVMVWGGITARNRTQLVIIDGNLNAATYRDDVLAPAVVPFLQRHGPGIILQQDNARPHAARAVQQYLQQQQVDVLPWPANSPDLSPIEHVWDEMKRQLRRLPHAPTTLVELQGHLVRIWNNIPQNFHANLFASMRRRCTAVVNANGGHTRC